MLIIVFVITGLLLIGVSIPLMQGKVSPNNWYGFRVKLTLENPDIWYPANAYAGKLLLATGVITLVAAVVCAFVPGITEDAYAITVIVIMLGSLSIALFFSMRYAKSLANRE
jgi:hypothetical protein